MFEGNKLTLPNPEPLHEEDTIDVPYYFVADDAFAMTENLLKPHGVGPDPFDREKRIFNNRLSRARRDVEIVFGILASRFGVYQRPMMLSLEKATIVTIACCYLHNFLRKKSDRYLSLGNVDWEDANYNINDGEWRATQRDLAGLCPTFRRNMTERAKFVRETLQRYFCNRGSGPWQLKYV
ncbi:hypothetical protein PoB_007666100 [Plakobranchus ocellatus]|uniref:DDE Tnp4 domain-containing protein n=1 Tax=Plakobranchus ocellatus TaxID=259542 RepID=A0AAV4E279_9GAST|nr:hypothetical protein PoB_007666100 [Plakobranchus ocellatus]